MAKDLTIVYSGSPCCHCHHYGKIHSSEIVCLLNGVKDFMELHLSFQKSNRRKFLILVCNIFMLRQKMHLWITEESKKTKICKNGSVYSVKGQECSKHRKSSRKTCNPQECKDNRNIFCQCGNECNLNKCYNNKKIYDDGCECDPKVSTIWDFSSAFWRFLM